MMWIIDSTGLDVLLLSFWEGVVGLVAEGSGGWRCLVMALILSVVRSVQQGPVEGFVVGLVMVVVVAKIEME